MSATNKPLLGSFILIKTNVNHPAIGSAILTAFPFLSGVLEYPKPTFLISKSRIVILSS